MTRHLLINLSLIAALLGNVAGARAAPGDDQFAVAAGHYRRGRWELALEEFRKFQTGFPDHAKQPDAAFFAGETLVQLGRRAESRDQFQQYLEKYAQHRYAKQARFRRAEAHYLLSDFAAAQPELEKFQADFPDDPLNSYVLPYLGELAFDAGRFDEAQRYFDAALARFPEGKMQDDCRFGLAKILERESKFEEAGRLYLALAGKPKSPLADDAQYRLGALEYAQGRHAEALRAFEAFEKEFAESPLKPRARLGRAWAFYHLGEFEKAQKFLEILVKYDAIRHDAQYWLGLTLKAQNQWMAAVQAFDALDATAPADLRASALFHAGDALWHGDQAADGAARLDRVLKEFPASPIADEAALLRAQMALKMSQHEVIDQLVRQSAERKTSPFWPQLVRLQVRSLIARKQYVDAIAQIEPIVAAAADQPASLDRFLLASAYFGAQRYEDALRFASTVAADAEGELRVEALALQGAVLVALERFEPAIAPLEECRESNPPPELLTRCLAQLAICRARIGQFPQAKALLTELEASKPAADLLFPTILHLAEAAFAAEEFDWSRQLFETVAAEPAPAEYRAKGLSGRGWSHFRQERWPDAEQAFTRLLNEFPDDPLAAEGAVAWAQTLEKLNQPEKALSAFELVTTKYAAQGDLPQALLGMARLQEKLRQTDRAAATYARLATDYPELPQRDLVLYRWAWVLNELDRAEEADQRFDELRQKYPNSPFRADAWYRLAERKAGKKEYDQAGTLLRKLLESQPPAAIEQHALYLQGQIAITQQDWAAAAQPLAKLVSHHPQSPLRLRAEYWQAEALYRQGKYGEAVESLEMLEKAIESARQANMLPPDVSRWSAMVPLRQAQALVHLKRLPEARQIADRLKASQPDFEQMYEVDYVLGRCLAGKGEFAAAREAFLRVCESEAGAATETAAMAQWMLGETYFHQKNFEAAVREFLKVEILYAWPDWQASALLEAGKCYEQLNDWKQAVETYQRAIQEFPEASARGECQERLDAAQRKLTRN